MMTILDWAQMNIDTSGLKYVQLQFAAVSCSGRIRTWYVTCTTWISILPPCSTYSVIFIVDLKINVAEPLRYAYA